jgi:hypothetical protein
MAIDVCAPCWRFTYQCTPFSDFVVARRNRKKKGTGKPGAVVVTQGAGKDRLEPICQQ